MKKKTLYICGIYRGSIEDGSVWDIKGIFELRSSAVRACTNKDCFVGEIELGKDLGSDCKPWEPSVVYPLLEAEVKQFAEEIIIEHDGIICINTTEHSIVSGIMYTGKEIKHLGGVNPSYQLWKMNTNTDDVLVLDHAAITLKGAECFNVVPIGDC